VPDALPMRSGGELSPIPIGASLTGADRAVSARREGPSRRLVFGIVAFAQFMAAVDVSIVATALPAIHRGLAASINWTGWTITIYSLGMVAALPAAGRLGDQFGRRRVFLSGLSMFSIASLLCGFSTSIYMLIAFRALQAIGGGSMMPACSGIIADHFGGDRDRALGMLGTIAAAGNVVGPIFGGLFVGYLSWRWIFFINVPIGLLLILSVIWFIPESRLSASSKVDVRGLILMVSFVLSAILGITLLGNAHVTIYDPVFLVPSLCAPILLYLFIRHSSQAETPFIPIRFLFGRSFVAINLENLLWGFTGFGILSLLPLYAENRYHLKALSAGTLLTARGVGMMAVGTIATFALRRTGYRRPLILGFTLAAVSSLLIAISPKWAMTPYWWLGVGAGISGLSNGISTPALRNASLQFSPEDLSALTGLRQMFVYLGMIFSISIDTAILNRSTTPGITQAHIFVVAAAVAVLVMVPLVFGVPEHKGRW
jgi:EmrB/QacA subfamily drug resistance transporter